MGKEKYLRDIERLFKKSPVVKYSSIERIVKSKNRGVKQYIKQLVRNLLLKGKIKRLTKGHYTMHDDPSLAVYCFKPAYLGLQDAISFHNLWEQETVPVIITARKVRPGLRRVLGMNVLIRRLSRKYFFGFDYREQGNFYLPYSDIEKTLIDMLYFMEPVDKKLLKKFKSSINKKKLSRYLGSYPLQVRGRLKI